MLRKKIFKISSVLVAVLIAFSIFLIPVSAETIDGQFYNGIKVTGLTVNLIKSDGSLIEVDPTVVYNNSLEAVGSGDAPGYYVEFQNPNGLMVQDEYYTIVLHLITQSYLQTSDNYVIGGYDVLCSLNYDNIGYFSASRSGGGHTQTTMPTVANAYGFNGINVNYSAGTLGHLYTSYVCSFRIHCVSSQNAFVLYIKNIDLRVISPSEKAAQSVIDNQNKNTDKILNGGHDAPSYSAPDTTVVDEYHSAEDKVLSDANSHWDNISHYFDVANVTNTIRASKFYRGMFAVTNIMEEFIGIDWLGDIVLVAFCLGAFGFVVGISSLLFSRAGSDAREYKSYKNRVAYQQYLYRQRSKSK